MVKYKQHRRLRLQESRTRGQKIFTVVIKEKSVFLSEEMLNDALKERRCVSQNGGSNAVGRRDRALAPAPAIYRDDACIGGPKD